MTTDILVRAATLADIETLRAFEQGVIDAERPFDVTLKNAGVIYYDLEGMLGNPAVALLVAEHNDQLIAAGYARIENAKPRYKHRLYAYLGFMYVVPAWRGKGINQKILDSLCAWAVAKGITELRLEVYEDNVAAIRAYEKVGFIKHMVEMRLALPHT